MRESDQNHLELVRRSILADLELEFQEANSEGLLSTIAFNLTQNWLDSMPNQIVNEEVLSTKSCTPRQVKSSLRACELAEDHSVWSNSTENKLDHTRTLFYSNTISIETSNANPKNGKLKAAFTNCSSKEGLTKIKKRRFTGRMRVAKSHQHKEMSKAKKLPSNF